jgi:hypothetical protein
VFITSTGEAPGTDRFEIAGDGGRVVLENGKLTFVRNEVDAKEFLKTSENMFGKPETWNVEVPVRDEPDGHHVITQNFVDAILDGTQLIAPAEEGIHSVELANAMLFSSALNATIDIPLDGEAYEEHLKKLISESSFQKRTVETGEADMGSSFR